MSKVLLWMFGCGAEAALFWVRNLWHIHTVPLLPLPCSQPLKETDVGFFATSQRCYRGCSYHSLIHGEQNVWRCEEPEEKRKYVCEESLARHRCQRGGWGGWETQRKHWVKRGCTAQRAHTSHTCQWLVVCGLNWRRGGGWWGGDERCVWF